MAELGSSLFNSKALLTSSLYCYFKILSRATLNKIYGSCFAVGSHVLRPENKFSLQKEGSKAVNTQRMFQEVMGEF